MAISLVRPARSDGPFGAFEATGMMELILRYNLLTGTQAIDGGEERICLSKVAQGMEFTERASKERSARFCMDEFTDPRQER